MSLPADRHRSAQRACVALGLLLVLPALAAGFFADDFVQIAQLERWSANPAGPLDLYSFVPRDPAAVERLTREGWLPYFTAPELRIAFLRPLASALMAADHALFGRWAPGYHAHTLLWYAALLVIVAALLRRVLPPAMATLVLLLFCLDDGHAMAAGWVAARNATVACVFGFLGLVAHIRWRSEGWRPGAVLAPLAAALGLAAGEMGLGVLAYVLAWELVERRPGRGRALAPTLALIAVYLVCHRLTGSGARASGSYLDPFGDPLTFATALPGRVLLLLGNLFAGAPIDGVIFEPLLRVPLLVLGGVAALGVALWLPRALRRLPADEVKAVRWLGLGAAGALLVSSPALLGERVLLAASLGGAAILGVLLRDAWRAWRKGQARALAAVGLLALGLPNLALAALALAGKVLLLRAMSEESLRFAREAEIAAPVPARVVVLAVDDLVALHLPVLRVFASDQTPEALRRFAEHRDPRGLPLPDRLGYLGTTVLSLSPARHRLRRTTADTFELSTPDGTLLDGAWARTLRASSLPLPRGSVVQVSGMTATVLDDRQGNPTRVELRFDRPLEDPSLVFLVFSGGGLRRFALPAPGHEVAVPHGRPFLGDARDLD